MIDNGDDDDEKTISATTRISCKVKLHHPLSFYIIPFLLLLSRQQQQHGVDGFSRSIVKLPAVTFSGSSSSSSSSSVFNVNHKQNYHTSNHNGNVIQSRSSRTTTSTRRARTTRSRMSMSMSLSLSNMMLGTLPAAVNAERLLQLAETLAPKVGILTSTVLYLAPATAVWEAIQRAKQQKKKSHNKNNDNDTTRRLLSELNPLPIALMPMVAVSWFVYGLVSSDPYIILSNCVGSFLSIAYLIGILPLMKYNTITTTTTTNKNSGTATSSNNNNNSNNHLLFWTHTTILLSTATTLGVWALLGFITSSATETLSLGAFSATSGVVDEVLGMYASLLFILLCGSPLSTIQHVVSTKNSSSILGRFTLAQCLNTTLWSVYGLAVNDRFVYGPNCIGLGLGLIQLALKIIFPASRRGRPPPPSSSPTTPVTA